MPPVMTGSMPDPSGRQRKMWDARVTNGLMPWPLVGLLGERALAPVDPSVGAEVRPVQIVAAVGHRLALKPFDALIGNADPFGVGEFPDARHAAHIDRTGVPEHALGEHHAIGVERSLGEMAIGIRRPEAKNAVRLVHELFFQQSPEPEESAT